MANNRRKDVDKQIDLLNRFAGLNLSLSSYRPGTVRLYQVWQNEGMKGGKPLHRHHEPIAFIYAFLQGIGSMIDEKPCTAQPKAGQTYRDDAGNMHSIIEVTTMFHKPCIRFQHSMQNHYIALNALHQDHNQQFWFKEPLTDQL